MDDNNKTKEQLIEELHDLKRELSFMQSIYDSPTGIEIFVLDKNYCYTAFTKSHKEKMKIAWGTEIRIGINMPGLISDGGDRNIVKKNFDRVFKGECFINTREYCGQSLPGVYYESHYHPVKDTDGKIVGVSVFEIDDTEHVIAEKTLKESEKKFRSITEQSNDFIGISDENGFITYASPIAQSVFGISPQDMFGQNFIGFVQEPDRAGAVREFRNCVAGFGQIKNVEFRMKRADGTLFTGELSCSKFQSGTMVIIRDITERKKADEETMQREEELNYSQEIAKMGNWELDLTTNKVKWSKNYYHLMGLIPSDENVPADYFRNHLHPEDAHLMDEKLREIYRTKDATSVDVRLFMADGRIKWLQNNIVPVFEGNKLISLRGVNIDITDKKVAEEKIRHQNDRLQAIISAMPDLIFVIDKEGTYTEFYSSDTESLVIAVQQIVGTNLRSVFDETSAIVHLKNINLCIGEKKLISYEYSITKSDSIRYYEARLAPLGTDRVLTSVRDITLRKKNRI